MERKMKIGCMLLILCALLLNGCAISHQKEDTTTVPTTHITTAAAETTATTVEVSTTVASTVEETVEATTEVSTETTNLDKDAIYGIDRPEYGIELVKKSLADIIKMLNGSFDVKWAESVDYAQENRVYICNESVLPGMWFFIGDASNAMLNGEYSNDREEALDQIKQDILNNKYDSFTFLNVREPGNFSKNCYVGMSYTDFSEQRGEYGAAKRGFEGKIGQFIDDYDEDIKRVIVFYESIPLDAQSPSQITPDVLKENNPKINQFIIIPKE